MPARTTGQMMKAFAAVLIAFHALSVRAQEMWGISVSNYAGVAGVALNPSSMISSKILQDFHLLQADIGGSNNAFYLQPRDQSPWGLLGNNDNAVFTNNERNFGKEVKENILLNGDIPQSTFAFGNLTVRGPSFMYAGSAQGFCIFSGYRTVLSAHNLPYHIVKLAFEESVHEPLQRTVHNAASGTQVAVMSWSELGASYARRMHDRNLLQVDAGISLKWLIGHMGGYMKNDGSDYSVPYNYHITTHNLNLQVAHAYSGSPFSMNMLGTGAAGDIGITIMKKKHYMAPYYGCPSIIYKSSIGRMYVYKWKLGISLVDVGAIRFSTKARQFTYRRDAGEWDSVNTLQVQSTDDLDRELLEHWPNASVSNKFTMWMPMGLSAQLDYAWRAPFFVHLGVMQRIRFGDMAGPVRMNTVALIPRVETELYEAAFPLMLVEYSQPYVGFMFRYKYFFVGTEQLGSTVGLSKLNGLDFYFGMRFYFLKTDRVKRQPFLGF